MPLDAVLRQVLDEAPPPATPAAEAATLREQWERFAAELPSVPLPVVTDRTIPGTPGVSVRVYSPVAEPDMLPVVVYFHGGGWVLGSRDTHDALARRIARDTGFLVVSVDYRLAPEYPYPTAVYDCWTAVTWVAGHIGELGGDPRRMAVAGDGAGGNLAAAMTLLAREHGGPEVGFQLLWYPVTTVPGDTGSLAEHADAPGLTAAAVNWFWSNYAGHLDGRKPPVTLAPAQAGDFSALPPAYVATVEQDPLRDDGRDYASRLEAAGVPVARRHDENLVHGYAALAGVVPAAAAAVEESLAALRAAMSALVPT